MSSFSLLNMYGLVRTHTEITGLQYCILYIRSICEHVHLYKVYAIWSSLEIKRRSLPGGGVHLNPLTLLGGVCPPPRAF